MLSYIIKRLLIAVPTLLGVTLLVFSMIHMIPGDPVVAMLGERGAIPEEMARLRTSLGLDEPLYMQYYLFVKKAVTFEFCISYWDAFKNKLSFVKEFLEKQDNPVEEYRNSETGGNLVFRPIGFLPLVKSSLLIYRREEKSFEEIIDKFNEVNFNLDSNYLKCLAASHVESNLTGSQYEENVSICDELNPEFIL